MPHKKLIVTLVSMAAVILIAWGAYAYMFPGAFRPVKLSQSEQAALDTKLEKIARIERAAPEKGPDAADAPLTPMRYSEENALREITFTEREINALIANNTDLAGKVAIDLGENLISARLRIKMDPDFPILGGKTLKAAAGLELRYSNGNPVVIVKGASLWGVPIPNAWLGDIKNVDLVEEFGDQDGFWKSFSEGVDHIAVENERLTVKFKE